jgi:hypothetical protein
LIAELWAADGAFVSAMSARRGRGEIEAEAAEKHGGYVARGYVFASANSSQSHHNLVRLKWHMRAKDTGEVAVAGADLLILDEDGRIRSDYQYDEPV